MKDTQKVISFCNFPFIMPCRLNQIREKSVFNFLKSIDIGETNPAKEKVYSHKSSTKKVTRLVCVS